MATPKTIISSTNNINYVEPNYTNSLSEYGSHGLDVYEFAPDLEDYSIFVNLEIETVGRTIQTGDKVYKFSYVSKKGGESVNLMGGSKIKTSDGKIINSLTTNWTDTHISDLKQVGASAELFGINSIDIEFNSFMVPQVTIDFSDVRGAAVFAQRELYGSNCVEKAIGGNYDENIVNTFFQCFFTFPYPKFTILVKGFYGQPVAYELSCADFRARFNSDSGNFSCTAKFVGYYFSFLNDVMVNALVAAPYSDYEGTKYWKERKFTFEGYNGDEVEIPKLGDLLKKIKKLVADVNQVSQNSPEVQEKTNIEKVTERYTEIKRLYETYVESISNLVVKKNDPDKGIDLFFSDLDDGKISEAAIILVENDCTKNFSERFDERNTNAITTAYNDLSGYVESFKEEYPNDGVDFSLLNNFATATTKPRIFSNGSNSGQYIIDKDRTNDDIKTKSSYLYQKFEKAVLGANVENGVNKYGKLTSAYFYNDGGFLKSLNNAMKSASDREKAVVEKIERTVNDELARELGWYPTVENVTKIMMAHFETFAHMIYATADYINNEDPTRDTKKVGITDDDDVADVPEIYRSSKTGCLLVPPFPNVTKIVDKNGARNREESWVGDYGNKFKEVDLIHGILNGISEVANLSEDANNTGSAGSTTSTKAVMKCPLSHLDFVLTSSVYGDFNQSETSDFLGLVCLRALQLLGTSNDDGWGEFAEVIGRAEAENVLSTEKLSTDFIRDLKGVLNGGINNVMSMIKGNNSDVIPKPSSGIWPWQESPQSVGIVAQGTGSHTDKLEFNICKVKGKSGSVTYTLPIQNLKWSTIKNDVIHGGKSAFSDDYFNISKTLITNVYKDNIFYIDTNIGRISEIAKNQMKDIDGIENLSSKILSESEYDSGNYEDFFDKTDIIAYPIKNAQNMLPSDESCMIPCTMSYVPKMTWGGGYNLNSFKDFDLGGDWKDKDGNSVTRTKTDGFEDFLKEHDTKSFTITEIPGLSKKLDPDNDMSLFTENLYYQQKDYRVKAFMLLCSLSHIYEYEDIIEDEICNKDKTISIIPLPAVIYAGGALWAIENQNLFVNCDLDGNKILNDCLKELYTLDYEVQLKLKKSFEKWVNKGIQNNDIIVSFKEIANNLEIKLKRTDITYDQFFNSLGEIEEDSWFFGKNRTWFKEGIFANQNYSGILSLFAGELGDSFFRNYICVDEDLGTNGDAIGMRVGNRDGAPGIKQLVDFALAPCIFMKNTKFFFKNVDKVLRVRTGKMETFFEAFLKRLIEDLPEESSDDGSASQAKEPETTTDIKVGVYRYCKLLYDKWIGGMSETDFSELTMEKFFSENENDRYFYFIDAYYNKANDILVNIGEFCQLVEESYISADYSLLSLLSTVYSKNGFNFFCPQNFIDLSKREKMEQMFDCIPYTEHWDVKRHPNFVVNYAYEASSHLDIEGSEYDNDGFMLNMPDGSGNKWPEALKSRGWGETEGFTLPAFGVSYGKMYQSYFKDVSVSMDNPTVTEQSIKAQFAIASLNNETKNKEDDTTQYYYGQDLYAIYSNNSYTCEVTMMGCAWVQPLMLFVLNNVPMFRGTYQIINVTHHIEQGDMITKFKGVRMANVTTRLVEQSGVRRKSDQTNAGTNAQRNGSMLASPDNDCDYPKFPLMVNGSAGGGIPEEFLSTNYNSFCGGNVGKYDQGNGYGTTWLTDPSRTIGEVLCAAIGAEYKGFTQNNNLMLRVSTAMICNKYHWCKENNKWVYLFGTKQQGTGNKAANQSTYDAVKDIVMPVLINGPACLVGETAKVQGDCRVEMWNRGQTKHEKAPSTHTITIDDMQRVFAYCTMGGYDYEHIGVNKECVGNQTRFETKAIPNNGNSTWKKADFLFQEYNSVFTSSPSNPGEKFWEPAPPITNNNGQVSEFANGFLHAINQTAKASSVNVDIGINKDKSSGDTIYLVNGHTETAQNFSKVLDIMLNTYSEYIQQIDWIVPTGGNQNLPPAGYLVYLKDGSTQTIIRVVSEENGEPVQDISLDAGGMHEDFKKALRKKYKDNVSTLKPRLVRRDVKPTMDIEKCKSIFSQEIEKCPDGSTSEDGTTTGDGPFNTTAWDVDAFVKNLHYWQKNVCEKPGNKEPRTREKYGGCHWCTAAINRALRDTGFGQKYWANEPWDVRAKLKADNSDFAVVDEGVFTGEGEFPFVNPPEKGDICTFWSEGNKKAKRHTCAFDGSRWISDYVQSSCRIYNNLRDLNWCRVRHK